MSKPWPESRGKSLDEALTGGWLLGSGLAIYWMAPHLTWWERLLQVLVFVGSAYAIRRWQARLRRARGTYSGEYRRGGMVLRVESNDLGVVEQTIRRMSDQAREAWQDAQHKDA